MACWRRLLEDSSEKHHEPKLYFPRCLSFFVLKTVPLQRAWLFYEPIQHPSLQNFPSFMPTLDYFYIPWLLYSCLITSGLHADRPYLQISDQDPSSARTFFAHTGTCVHPSRLYRWRDSMRYIRGDHFILPSAHYNQCKNPECA